jgi:HK97 family phage portal protein
MGAAVSIWQSFKSLATFSPPEFKQATFTTGTYSGIAPGDVFGPLGQRNADWSSIATTEKIRHTFGKCATAYACATLLADAVAESPLRVYRTVDGDLEEVPDHWLRAVIANPNPALSEAEFMSMIVMVQCLFGYAVVEKVRSTARLVTQLWPLRPDWLKRERTNDGAGRWVLRVPGLDPRPIADDDLLIIPYRQDERFGSFGVSPLHIVAREVGIDVALTDLLKVFLDAGGIPPWAVTVPHSVTQTDIDLFREKWRQTYGGPQAYANIGVMAEGMQIVKIGDSIGDMAWPDLRGLTELKIAQAFRVPADLVQARDTLKGGSLTTTEIDGAMAYLQLHGAMPLRQRIDGAFTRGLLAEFGDPSLSLEFDTSGIGALQEDKDALHTRVRANWDSGLIMLDEARQAIGVPELPSKQGQVFKVAFTTMFVPPQGLGGGAEPNGASEGATVRSEDTSMLALPGRPKQLTGTLNVEGWTFYGGKTERQYRDLKALSPVDLEVRAASLQRTQRDRQRLVEIGTRKLRTFFREQGRRIVADFPKSERDLVAMDRVKFQNVARGVDVFVTKAINWDDEDERLWREVMKPFYQASGERAFDGVNAVAGTTISFDLANPNVSRIVEQLGKRIVDISETTRADVVRVIAEGQAEGLSLSQIADSIRDLFEQTYKSRAETVARTETQVSYNLASQLGYQESGVVENVELVDNPDHTEDYSASDGLTCAERHGLVVNVGLMDQHVYAEHPNGSLACIPILSGPALGEV